MNNKRGISAIVAMVLIILITVALVIVLWTIIIPLINEQLFFAEQCRIGIASTSLEHVCGNETDIYVTLSRSSEEHSLIEFQVLATFNDGRDYITRTLTGEVGGDLNWTIPKPNEKRVYHIEDSNFDPLGLIIVDSIQLAPIVFKEKKWRICDPTPEYYFKTCTR